MRNVKLLTMLLAVVGLLIVGCDREISGDVQMADNSSTSCFECHSDQSFELTAAKIQWEASTHYLGGNFERNGTDCSRCHTNEGFVAYQASGEMIEPDNPSPIGCFTCHAPHTNATNALRTIEPVTLERGDGIFDNGAGNICANCHQARIPSPEISGAVVSISSSRWGPHHGAQANIVAGSGCYSFDGSAFAISTGHANAENGCVDCHMPAAYGSQAGGHTFDMNYEYHGSDAAWTAGCESCHGDPLPDGFDFNYGGVQDSVEVLLGVLQSALWDAGVLDEDDLVITGDISEDNAKAIYNYLMLSEEGSLGVHNPAYAYDVLNKSIEAITAD